jgi:hypothetical protein
MCDNDATLKNLWDTQYQQIVHTPSSNFAHQSYAYKISQALCFLDDNGIPGEFNFFTFFKKIVSYAVVKPQSSSGAFAASDYSHNEIDIYPPYFDNDPIMDYKRASVLVHEARHIQMNEKHLANNTHVVCNNGGELNGLRNCDQEFTANWDTGSATSYEVMFLRKLYDDSTYNLNKAYLKKWIVYLLDNSFNSVSPELREQFTKN